MAGVRMAQDIHDVATAAPSESATSTRVTTDDRPRRSTCVFRVSSPVPRAPVNASGARRIMRLVVTIQSGRLARPEVIPPMESMMHVSRSVPRRPSASSVVGVPGKWPTVCGSVAVPSPISSIIMSRYCATPISAGLPNPLITQRLRLWRWKQVRHCRRGHRLKL